MASNQRLAENEQDFVLFSYIATGGIYIYIYMLFIQVSGCNGVWSLVFKRDEQYILYIYMHLRGSIIFI